MKNLCLIHSACMDACNAIHTVSLNICRIWMNASLTNFLFTAESVLHL